MDTPVPAVDVTDPVSLIEGLFVTGIGGGINTIFNLFKINAGINYTIMF